MNTCCFITTLAITAFFSSPAYANDLNPLQDICLNGKICKDPKPAKADDFFASGLNVSGNAVPKFGIDVNMPGL
ncbi:hypothetical protein RND71_025531 [Anisodus tanguticus]|uniref:Uncharacterized protein n=1 Tax=Anisodus tanguticus TaxID=243964 RepID=A0AAE1VDI5_9SOLA|nr:hypothetical protein RND71_025531 [Anisodus tanguticus]